MTTLFDVPAPATATTTIFCGQCGTHPFSIGPDGAAHCPCGHTITTADLVLDPGEEWCVRPDQTLGYLTAPETALTRYREALDLLNDHGVYGEDRKRANEEFTAALADLTTARLMGVRLPKGPGGAPAEIGRVFLACVLTPVGEYEGSNAFWLGRPCVTCAPYSLDPYYQELHPCRNPRTHAWGQVATWGHVAAWERRTGRAPRGHTVFSPVASDIDAAREQAGRRFNSLRVADALDGTLDAATDRVRRTQLPAIPDSALKALADIRVTLRRNPAQGAPLELITAFEDTCEEYRVIAAGERTTCHAHRQLTGDCCPA
ncbi:hypothetical protein ACIQ9R_36180 [Streptomyces sp. NPDC094447]|uniref:hypothetical protein n=1 Tax=Streptomyces sp. NPDC094447 TaxID=3366062 RepID=UPI0038125DFD